MCCQFALRRQRLLYEAVNTKQEALGLLRDELLRNARGSPCRDRQYPTRTTFSNTAIIEIEARDREIP